MSDWGFLDPDAAREALARIRARRAASIIGRERAEKLAKVFEQGRQLHRFAALSGCPGGSQLRFRNVNRRLRAARIGGVCRHDV